LHSAQDVRVKIKSREFLNFTSNDYLGLANHPKVKEALIAGVKKYGAGSGASHLISGHQTPHHELELAMADFFKADKALLFSSGFMANLGLIDTLAERGSLIIQDKLNHASILDAARLSRAGLKRYRHNDMGELENLLVKNKAKEKLLVSDSVFSMDGDVAKIKSLVSLAKQYSSALILDEAHGFGVLGENGRGAVFAAGKLEDKPIIMATLGKALGTYGAIVAGPADLVEYLVQKARTYTYTTSLPPALAHASLTALELLKNADDKRAHLLNIIQRFKANMRNINVRLMDSKTPIQPLIVGRNSLAIKLAEKLYERNILVQAIRPPTVPENSARLRFTFSANHTLDEIDVLSQNIKAVL